MARKWWQEPVRMMRVDYAPDWESLKDLDLEEAARSHKEDWQVNCEWVVGSFGWDGCGHLTSFRSEHFKQWPGLEGFDYLRSYVPHAHHYGIRVLSYLNMHWFTEEFAREHPDWEQIMSDGRPRGEAYPLYDKGRTFCVNGGWRDWAFTMMQEAMRTGINGVFLDGPVVFPDCCYCAACQALFQGQYGQRIPKEDWTDPLWRRFVDFREDSLARFLGDARQKVQEVNPEGVVFLNGGSWVPGGWRVARDIQKLEPYQHFSGAEAFFHYHREHNLYMYSMAGKYLRASSNPAIVFVHYMNGEWHYRMMPPREMQFAIVQTVASGANPWLAIIHSSLKSQPDGHEAPGEIFGFLEANKAYYTGMRSVAEVALLFSSRTAQNYLSRFGELFGKPGSGREENLMVDSKGETIVELTARKRQCENLLTAAYEGYFRALTRAHVLFDIIMDQDLTNGNLTRYQALVLPDGTCLSREGASAVREFVERGGALLASFEAGFYDDQGEFSEALLEVLGIEAVEGAFPPGVSDNYLEATEDHWGFAAGCLIERGPYAMKVKARRGAWTPARFRIPVGRSYVALKGLSEYPALLASEYGGGKVVYFPEGMGVFVGDYRMPTAEARIVEAMKHLLPEPMIEVRAPKTVSVDAYRTEESQALTIHLVNNTVDGRAVTEFLPVADISISVRTPTRPAKVFALREKEKVTFSWCDGQLEIRLPRLTMYEVIVIE